MLRLASLIWKLSEGVYLPLPSAKPPKNEAWLRLENGPDSSKIEEGNHTEGLPFFCVVTVRLTASKTFPTFLRDITWFFSGWDTTDCKTFLSGLFPIAMAKTWNEFSVCNKRAAFGWLVPMLRVPVLMTNMALLLLVRVLGINTRLAA